MIVSVDNAIQFLSDQIKMAARHKDYDRTIEVRRFSRQMMDLEKHNDIIERFRRFENEELKRQRAERLYVSPTGLIVNRLRKYWRKVKNLDGISFEIAADGEKIEALKKELLDFEDAKSAFNWLTDSIERLGATDPNSWIVFEREDDYTVGGLPERTRIYPVIFSSADSLNWSMKFGNVEWVVFSSSRLVQDAKTGASEWLTDYFLYGGGFTVRFRSATKTAQEEGEEVRKVASVSKKTETFYSKIFTTGYPYVPALRAGSYEDDHTEGRTYVPWFYAAQNALIDLIRDKNFLDVTKAVHVFLRRYEYVKPCDYKDETGACCERGTLTGGRSQKHETCPACAGHGLVANFTSEQQVLQLKMPDSPAQLLELGKLSFYENLPIDLPKFLADEVEKSERRVMLHVVNPGLLKGSAVRDKTATEVEFDYQDIQAVVEPFASTVSKFMVVLYQTAAAYFDIAPNGDLPVSHSFPTDFRFETVSEAIRNLNDAKAAGAGYATIKKLRRIVWEKVYSAQPEMVKIMEARMAWMPFDDKGEDERAAIVSARDTRDPVRILYENHAVIFDEIEDANPKFYLLSRQKQKAAIDKIVARIAAEIVPVGETITIPDESAAK